jgi:hypothetical protein
MDTHTGGNAVGGRAELAAFFLEDLLAPPASDPSVRGHEETGR